MRRELLAAQVLYRHGDRAGSRQILQHLWDHPQRPADLEFEIFCALIEVWAAENMRSAAAFIDELIQGESPLTAFWDRRSISERATLYDWHGQMALALGDKAAGFESLARAASLGRDTPVLWMQLGVIYVENEDLDMGLRYIRRSLQLFRQPDFDILSGRDFPLGFFRGTQPLNSTHSLESYLEILLVITRLAKGQRNLKAVRELVVEMIHQFPEEARLMKIRLLLEKAIVQNSLEGPRA